MRVLQARGALPALRPLPERQLLQVLQVLCVTLALLILVVVSRLLYDYWHYRSRGKGPSQQHTSSKNSYFFRTLNPFKLKALISEKKPK